MKTKNIILIIVMCVIGTAAIIAAIFLKKPKQENAPSASESISTENIPTSEETATTKTYTEDDIRQYQERISYLEKDNEDLRAKLYVNKPEDQESLISEIKTDLVLTYQLYHNLQCNFGWICKYRYLYHSELIDSRLTKNGINAFFSKQYQDDIKNKTNDYAIDFCSDGPYEINQYIDYIDVLISEPDSEKLTANYVCIYRLFEERITPNGKDQVRWRIVYGQVVYDTEKAIWQADEIYEIKEFSDDPENFEKMQDENKAWLENSGYHDRYIEYGSGH